MRRKEYTRMKHQPVIRELEFCIISAQGLQGSSSTSRLGSSRSMWTRNRRKKLKTYAIAYIDPKNVVSTIVDCVGDEHPSWDAKLSLGVDDRLLKEEELNRTQLSVEIYSCGSVRDKLIGSVRILICDAIRENRNKRAGYNNSYPVTTHLIFTPKGEVRGMLNMCIPPGGRFPLDSQESFKMETMAVGGTSREDLEEVLKDGGSTSTTRTSSLTSGESEREFFQVSPPEFYLNSSGSGSNTSFSDFSRSPVSGEIVSLIPQG